MPAQYLVTSQSLTAHVVTLELAGVAGLYVGWPVHVSGLDSHYNGNHTLTGVDSDTNTVTYAKNVGDHPETSTVGLLVVRVTWCDTADVETYLGLAPATPTDEDYLDMATEAGNKWAYDRRNAAGYTDLPSEAPDQRVKLGTVLKCAELYRQRGSVDTFASFNNLEGVQPVGSNAEVLRLLGINRPGIA